MENPFIVVGKIKPEYFCDRQEESQRLIRQMTNGANTVIISPRRLGKTGLIGYCFNNTEVQENYITIFIDILRTSSLNELIYILGKKVFETIGTRSQRLMKLMVTTLKTLNGSFGYDPINNTPTFDIKLGDITNPTYTLEEIFACIEQADKRCIIAIDEFQQIVNYSEKNIEAILRTHIQHCSNANFIFAGSERHIMNEIFLDTARPFYNSAEMMMLKPIAETKYKEFVQGILSIVEKLNKKYRTKDVLFNCEMIPAENVGVKHAKWDREDGYFVPRDCYNSYFYIVEDQSMNIIDKFKLHGAPYIEHLTGGSALHMNLEEHLSKKQYQQLLKVAAKEGCNYFTFNIPNTICNNCGAIDKRYLHECPNCHSTNVDYMTRIIGYLKRVSNFSAARQKEAARRYYAGPNKLGQPETVQEQAMMQDKQAS